MQQTFSFQVTVTTQRESGKFASRDEIEDQIRQALQDADVDGYLDGLGVDGDSVYTADVEVS